MNILDTIVEQKKHEVAKLPAGSVTVASLQKALNQRGDLRDFAGALRQPRRGSIGLIAEVKKASPSAGVICPDFDPVRIAKQYEAAGASCLSVLTDEKFFQGSLDYLKQIRAVVKLPLLRKDFIIDARQILEAVEWGADAILLIVAILSDAELKHFHELATGAGLAVLVEVHDEAELERATLLKSPLIGINNRNLHTFEVTLETTRRLARRVPEDRMIVAESGLFTPADLADLAQYGARAFLIGESLMRQADVAAATRAILSHPLTAQDGL